jgi:ABC-type branched-subunit amino acid transport system permease subunit
MRAIADDAPLAAARGFSRQHVITVTWVMSGVLAALSGALIGLDATIDPQMGWFYALPAFAAAILGGLTHPLAAIPGALTLLAIPIISGVVGLALNIQWSVTGLVNFGLFGFYMVGAHACALLMTQLGWPAWQAIIAVIVLTTVVCALVSLISIRLEGDYFAIVTLAFAESVKLIVNNEEWLTRGSIGIPGISRPFSSNIGMLVFAFAGLGLVFAVFETVSRSPLGRTARALRDDPLVAETLGKNVLGTRLRMFALGGAALGGAACLLFITSILTPHSSMWR